MLAYEMRRRECMDQRKPRLRLFELDASDGHRKTPLGTYACVIICDCPAEDDLLRGVRLLQSDDDENHEADSRVNIVDDCRSLLDDGWRLKTNACA